jgi:hypothetical protein
MQSIQPSRPSTRFSACVLTDNEPYLPSRLTARIYRTSDDELVTETSALDDGKPVARAHRHYRPSRPAQPTFRGTGDRNHRG